MTDSFDRADSLVTLGDTDTGQTWDPLNSSVFGIASNTAQYVSGASDGRCWAVVECPSANGRVSIVISTVGTAPCIVGRCTDEENLWFVRIAPADSVQLKKREAGSIEDTATAFTVLDAGDTLTLVFDGNNISVEVNDVVVIEPVSSAFNNTAVLHGFGVAVTGSTASRFDDFSWEPL